MHDHAFLTAIPMSFQNTFNSKWKKLCLYFQRFHVCAVQVVRDTETYRENTNYDSWENHLSIRRHFLVSLERSKVSLHNFQEVRKEQKHNDVIASWEFHNLKQVNCAGEHKRNVSQHSSKKPLRNQKLTLKWLSWKMSFMWGCMVTLTCTYTYTHTYVHTHTQNICTNQMQ